MNDEFAGLESAAATERALAADVVTVWDRDVRRAMRGVLGFEVHFSRGLAAQSLWDYGEDALVDRALVLTDKELAAVRRIAAVYEDPAYPLPVPGTRITHRHVHALAVVAYVEGSLRPLARTRRRPEKNRPAHLVTPAQLTEDSMWP